MFLVWVLTLVAVAGHGVLGAPGFLFLGYCQRCGALGCFWILFSSYGAVLGP